MPAAVTLDELATFDRPVVVPADVDWAIVGLEQTGGSVDAVLAMAPGLEVRTVSPERQRQPASVVIRNLQLATVADDASAAPAQVRVDAVDIELWLDGRRQVVRGAATWCLTSFEVDLDGRAVVCVSGRNDHVEGVRLRTILDPRSIPIDRLR